MRFLLDANLPRTALATVKEAGHEAEFARDIGLAAAPDSEISAHARNTQAALLTRDLDFADIRRYPPHQHCGIVVLRLPDDAIARDIALVLERFLKESQFMNSLPGRLAIVEPERVRFRPPLSDQLRRSP